LVIIAGICLYVWTVWVIISASVINPDNLKELVHQNHNLEIVANCDHKNEYKSAIDSPGSKFTNCLVLALSYFSICITQNIDL
jgi:hypothetical protein